MLSLPLQLAASAIFLSLLSACATQGTGYSEAAASADSLGEGQARLVLLRPKDKDDGWGSAAAIRINGDEITGLSYGKFLFVDVPAGAVSISASGTIVALGACEIQVELAQGDTVYVDVGPRMSYLVAAAAGSLLGGLLVPAPQAAASATEAVVGSVLATSAGSTAGEVAAVSVEGRSQPCRGPFQLALMPESQAQDRLQELTTPK